MDAAALAGAGKLGFSATAFPAARQAAQQYALLNRYRVGTIDLNLNTANNPSGNIVLGIWNGTTFTPSLDGTQVNAVKCQYSTTIPTAFLKVLGLNSLTVAAQATAWAAPPGGLPPNACPFPVGVSACFFQGQTSLGCGALATFITSSDESQLGANSVAWVNLIPGATSVTASGTAAAVEAVVAGNCAGPFAQTGAPVPVNNGAFAGVIKNTIIPAFQTKYASSPTYEVKKADGTIAYQGKGWAVYVAVIDTGLVCPPGSDFVGTKTVVGWGQLVITQVVDTNGECAVANHWEGNPWDERCFVDKNGTATTLPPGWGGSQAIFGYYDCQYMPSPPAPLPGPISATALLKLVQ
jgi:hypothetical protein